MASYDKIVKYMVERFQAALAPLEQIVKNQQIMIAQNKQIIEKLAQLNGQRPPSDLTADQPEPVEAPKSEQ